MTNVDTFIEKMTELISSLKESISQEELYKLADDTVSGDIETTILPSDELDGTLGYISPEDSTISVDPNVVNISTTADPISEIEVNDEPVETVAVNDPATIPFEEAPNFRIYWRAWKEGNSTSGQTESKLETAQMARAEAMTKLYDLGFTDLEILAIETLKNEKSDSTQI